MKKSTKGEAVLSACQIEATRLNQLEYRRLQLNINLMQDDLKVHLARLRRQSQSIKYHYENVVRVVKPNPAYQLWKQGHTYDTTEIDSKNWLESRKLKQRSKPNTHQQISSPNEVSSESVRPLLVLLNNEVNKPTESTIDLNQNFLRPITSPAKKHLADQQRKNPLLAMLTVHPTNSNNPIRSQKSASSTSSFLPPIKSAGSRKSEQAKLTPSNTTQNIDALYRIALQNQTAYKSIDKTRIEKRKLLDREFAVQHRALKATIRSMGLVN